MDSECSCDRPLSLTVKFQCSDVFQQWLNTAKTKTNPNVAPVREIPAALRSLYLMNDYVNSTNAYYDERPQKLTQTINKEWNELLIKSYAVNLQNNIFTNFSYGIESAGLFHALKYFSISNQNGLVVGSQTPWVEAMCLFHGAKKIVTAEYNDLQIKHEKLSYIHPFDLAQNWRSYIDFDFVISFSSIEHCGLGRYGDPLDPFGDILEMQKISCLVKENGYFFIALSSGQDLLVWNAHRQYGKIRWSMILAGWKFKGYFYGSDGKFFETFPDTSFLNGYKHFVLVIQK